jgi:UDP-N-acetylmuramoyl-L-alanyl-D-glutamate--2,6-diaminopimelate ligase
VPGPIATRPADPPRTSLRTVAEWLAGGLLELRNADPEVTVTGVTISSERVAPGDLYVAPAGARAHGATFAPQAVRSGARAVLTDPVGADATEQLGVPVLVVERPRAILGGLAARIYGAPAEDLRLLAVTGTQGKTTTTRLAESALTTAGVAAAVVGTVGTRVSGTDVATSLTTPEAPDLHALFAVMREHDVAACALEVSSHALVMGRVDGVVFDLACFTNLGRDHLDFHADEEEYFAAKASLFTPERSRRGLVTVDDAHGRRLVDEAGVPVVTFSARGAVEADWRATDVRVGARRSTFTLLGPGTAPVPVTVPLPGDFNVANALCAVAGLVELGFPVDTVVDGLARSGGVPGRLEPVEAGQDFVALVDYAHKPDAVTAALDAVRPQTVGRLIVVLGAGGDRDPGKRPIMGEIAARLADVLVVTDDNPRSEEPGQIRSAILRGAEQVPGGQQAELHEVGDRRQAIRLAVSLAVPGDTVVVAGKGHESGQEVGGVVHPFDDRAVLREELTAR